MTAQQLSLVVSGAIILGQVAIGVYFLRFWRQTRERLFLWFAIAFLILTIERALFVSAPMEWVHEPQFYCTRLVAFLVIVWAILEKNRTNR